jgi:phospholipid-binding lipoprotein MlaA
MTGRPFSDLPRYRRFAALAVLCLMMTFAAGCATVPPGAGADPRDPFESFNRHMFAFNEGLDEAVLRPVAQFYRDVLPTPVRTCFSNAFANLLEPANAINNILQGKPADGVSDTCRFAINSTVGLLGCFDVASRMGLPRNREDFGQTLGVWGAGPGPFLVLPVLGPSTVRDAFGTFTVDLLLDPNYWIDSARVRYALYGARVIDARAQLLQAGDLISAAALDKYTFIRDGYLQRRRHLIYDGDPPRLTDPDDDPE